MKRYEDRTQTYTTKVCVETTCDICKQPVPKLSYYETNEVTIEHREGEAWPDGGSQGLRFEADICPTCFKTKVVPALKALGVTQDYEEYST